jgi:hypothetical protein
MPIYEYFAQTYSEARRKFLEAASRAKAELANNYVLPAQSGPNKEELVIDVARIGSQEARNLLLIISGTHGVEGFCGSGCQVGYFADQLFEALPADTGAVLIHALNPYGFAWLRRVDQCNVDLNRNFLDFSSTLPRSPGYDAIHNILVPADWDGLKRLEADTTLNNYIADKGLKALQAAVQGGQYSHPDGLFYGGKEKSWSNLTFHEILRKYVSEQVRNVAVLDLHTGLGPQGYGEPIYVGSANADNFERAQRWYGPSVKNLAKGDSISAIVTGSIADVFTKALPRSRTIYLALEYGTLPALDVLTALRADNWLHAVANQQSTLASAIKQQIRAAFYVDTPCWKAAVYGRFADFVLRASRGLATSV